MKTFKEIIQITESVKEITSDRAGWRYSMKNTDHPRHGEFIERGYKHKSSQIAFGRLSHTYVHPKTKDRKFLMSDPKQKEHWVE